MAEADRCDKTADLFSLKREAMERVDRNAKQLWKTLMLQTVMLTAKRIPSVTTDDVSDTWATLGYTVTTHEPRALGPIMNRAAKNGWIAKTDRVVNSRRASNHNRPIAVWNSMIYGA